MGRAVDSARLGLDLANRTASWTQQQVVDAIRKGLDEISPAPAPVPDRVRDIDPEEDAEPVDLQRDSLNTKMSQLLSRALDQNTRGSQAELYHHLLDQLVADEARILGGLSDGSSSPLVNVYSWRAQGKPVLENAALIGRMANVALPKMTPKYVTHLMVLGLVQTGPEDSLLKTEYEVLMAETMVLDAIKAGSKGPLPAKVEKLSLSLSELGHALWAAAIAQEENL